MKSKISEGDGKLKFIIDDKIYDTEKSTKMIDFRKEIIKTFNLVGSEYKQAFWKKASLYRTFKGNWFSTVENGDNQYNGYKESDESVKEILKDLNQIKLYNKYFGHLEEA